MLFITNCRLFSFYQAGGPGPGEISSPRRGCPRACPELAEGSLAFGDRGYRYDGRWPTLDFPLRRVPDPSLVSSEGWAGPGLTIRKRRVPQSLLLSLSKGFALETWDVRKAHDKPSASFSAVLFELRQLRQPEGGGHANYGLPHSGDERAFHCHLQRHQSGYVCERQPPVRS